MNRYTEVEDRSATDRKEAYHRVLGTIKQNSGHSQPVAVAASTVWITTISHGSLSHEASKRALQAARENEHVVRWRDEAGKVRYLLTPAGVAELPYAAMPIYAPRDEGPLREVIGTESERADPAQPVLETLVAHVRSLSTGGSD